MIDTSLTFKRNIFSNDIVTLNENKAIQQKIFTILNLMPGDIVYKDYVFSGLKQLLGENVSNVNASIMKEVIALALTNYVPEVEFVDAKITPDYDNQIYRIHIYYYVVNSTEQSDMEITLKTTN